MAQLMTEEQRATLLANGVEYTSNEAFDPPPVIRLYTPDAGAIWLLVSLSRGDQDEAFGLCDLGLGYPELGYVMISELEEVRGPSGFPVYRDRDFASDKPLSAWSEADPANPLTPRPSAQLSSS